MDKFPKRMFIAFPVEVRGIDRVREELFKSGRSLKVVSENNYHITVKFLGNTDRRSCDTLISSLDSSPRPGRVDCAIKGLGCFPRIADPSVIWAGMEYDLSLMEKIFLFAEGAAVAAGFPPERRRFVPHLTLARVRRDSAVSSDLKNYIKSSMETLYSRCVIDKLVLYESVLKKAGPEYTVFREWELL